MMFDAFTLANRYCQSLDWRKMSLHETCCMMLGLVFGILVPEKHKKTGCIFGIALFLITFVPLVFFLMSCAVEEEDLDLFQD